MLDQKLLMELQEYIDKYLITEDLILYSSVEKYEDIIEDLQESEIDDFINSHRQPTFQTVLFNYIDEIGVNDPEVYKKAGIDRKLFSKIRSKPDYHPRKTTILALALALELSKKETDKLLISAGYSLSDSDTTDLIIQFCLEKKIYDIDHVNQMLDYYSMKTLSGVK
ncbi:hypothetical protein [Peribacillus alkalitolerans]|uniref:hypothetical protein n=1 Tax=Peribacillus alkalitolerans TaxID=1550385 RepID=UPI0013D7EBE1|nr:hypothetical protein [Peribacillus alkalitolerans]